MDITTKKRERVNKEPSYKPGVALLQSISRLLAWCRTLDGIIGLVVLAIALAVRLYFAPFLMVTGDMISYESWGELLNANFLHVYSVNSTNMLNTSTWFTVPVYPPVALYLYGLVTKVYFGLGSLLGISLSHNVMTSHGLKVALKLPGIIADEIFLAVIYLKAIRLLPRKYAWIAALTYALSPGILITAVWWGQSDGFVAMLVLLGLLSAIHKKPVLSGIFFALAVNFKPTPVIFVPLALIYLLRSQSLRAAIRGSVAFIGVTALVWLPYILPPSFEILAFIHNASQINTFVGIIASRDAGNLWYLLGLGTQASGVPFYGPFSLNQVGEALFSLVVLIVLIAIWFDAREDLFWAGAALVSYGFFSVMTLQFERYLYPALGLFFLAALFNRRYWVLYVVTSLTYAINYEMSLFMYNAVTLSTQHQQMLLLHTDRWQLGLINCSALVFGLFAYVYAWQQLARGQSPVILRRFGPSAVGAGMSMAGAGGVPFTETLAGYSQSGAVGAFSSTSGAVVSRQVNTPPAPALGASTRREEASTIPHLKVRPRNLNRPPYVSIVIPCYNEEGNIRPMYERLTATLRQVTP